jgi:hypothetical protein
LYSPLAPNIQFYDCTASTWTEEVCNNKSVCIMATNHLKARTELTPETSRKLFLKYSIIRYLRQWKTSNIILVQWISHCHEPLEENGVVCLFVGPYTVNDRN